MKNENKKYAAETSPMKMSFNYRQKKVADFV
jgi:hypothetical protein